MIPLFKVFMSDEAPRAVTEVLNSGYIGQGPVVDLFEEKLRAYFNSERRPLTVNSATSAITLALHMVDAGPGDEVITTPMTCSATNTPIRNSGADIVWADVDATTGLIDPESVERLITDKTKAIVCVDWAGVPCDYEALRKFGIPIIEDAAHAIGTMYDGRHVADSGGDYVCFSLQAIKHLTSGDGGILVVPPDQHERAELLRWYGLSRKSSKSFRCAQDIAEAGFKFHMNDINASIGLSNLECLEYVVGSHRANARHYADSIKNPHVTLIPYDDRASYWVYTILVDDKQAFQTHMEDAGIATSPVHRRNDEFTAFSQYSRDLPGVSMFYDRQISIPVGWWLTVSDRDHVVKTINEWGL